MDTFLAQFQSGTFPAMRWFIRIAIFVSWVGLAIGFILGLFILFSHLSFVGFFLMLVIWGVSVLWWITWRVWPEFLELMLAIHTASQTVAKAFPSNPVIPPESSADPS